jgi:hypothetical protein
MVASLSVSGVSILAASGNSFFSVCRMANNWRAKAATVDSERPARHDVMRQADGLDLLRPSARCRMFRRGFGRLVAGWFCAMASAEVDREEFQRAAVAHRGRNRVRKNLLLTGPAAR